MPAVSTIMQWCNKYPEFAEQYARAREAGLDALADETLEIADDGRGDIWIDEEGVEHTNNDVVQRSRLRVDTRKWLLSKLAPKKYGDRIDHNHGGGITVRVDLRPVDTE